MKDKILKTALVVCVLLALYTNLKPKTSLKVADTNSIIFKLPRPVYIDTSIKVTLIGKDATYYDRVTEYLKNKNMKTYNIGSGHKVLHNLTVGHDNK